MALAAVITGLGIFGIWGVWIFERGATEVALKSMTDPVGYYDNNVRGTLSLLELAFGADNLSDTTIYDQCGLPQPGRTFRVQLRVR